MWDLKKYGENIALIDDRGNMVSYSELNSRQAEFAVYTEGRNLVFIICTNKIEALVSYISCIKNGNVPVLIDRNIDIYELMELIDSYYPEYLYMPYESQLYKDISGYKSGYESINTADDESEYILLKKATKFPEPEYKMNSELALLLSTSGSTGSSKQVRVSYENLLENTKSIIEYLNIGEKERTITSLPMNYTYGLSIINTYLYMGASIILTDMKITQSEFWRLFREYKVTSFSGVPYMYEMCYRLNVFGKDFPDLRVLTQAGGRLEKEMQSIYGEYCRIHNIKFYIMYGQTEATARMSYLEPDKMLEKLQSVGKPVPGGRINIQDEKGNYITKPYTQGEIIYEGKNVCMGYSHTYRDLNKDNEMGYILHTGDYGYCDGEGYIYITGRKDKYVKILGKRIDLGETEKIIEKKYGGSYLLKKADYTGNKIVGNIREIIEIHGEGDGTEIIEYAAQKLGINKKCFRFCYGKVKKRRKC